MELAVKITSEHYEAIGRMILALPDRNDEVKCLQVKELFEDDSIFDVVNGDWFFYAKGFLDKYPYIEQANHYADKIKEITNPITFTIPAESYIETVSLAENTGGNVLNDIITLKNGKVIAVTGEGIYIYKNGQDAYETGEYITTVINE